MDRAYGRPAQTILAGPAPELTVLDDLEQLSEEQLLAIIATNEQAALGP